MIHSSGPRKHTGRGRRLFARPGVGRRRRRSAYLIRKINEFKAAMSIDGQDFRTRNTAGEVIDQILSAEILGGLRLSRADLSRERARRTRSQAILSRRVRRRKILVNDLGGGTPANVSKVQSVTYEGTAGRDTFSSRRSTLLPFVSKRTNSRSAVAFKREPLCVGTLGPRCRPRSIRRRSNTHNGASGSSNARVTRSSKLDLCFRT